MNSMLLMFINIFKIYYLLFKMMTSTKRKRWRRRLRAIFRLLIINKRKAIPNRYSERMQRSTSNLLSDQGKSFLQSIDSRGLDDLFSPNANDLSPALFFLYEELSDDEKIAFSRSKKSNMEIKSIIVNVLLSFLVTVIITHSLSDILIVLDIDSNIIGYILFFSCSYHTLLHSLFYYLK